MTLNITVVSKQGIHQSSDFRLSSFKRDVNGLAIPVEDSSPKVVTVQYFQWSGFLTYCGIGKWDDIPTYRYVADWICACGHEASFEDLVRTIEREGSAWISSISKSLRATYPHTFILAGFVKEQPQLAVISNVDSTTGRLKSKLSDGLVASVKADASSHVHVTGMPSAVSKDQRILLKRLASHGAEPNVIRNLMARINEAASLSRESNNGISPSCMCYSLDKYSGGGGQVYGSVKGRFLPVAITFGVVLSDNPLMAQLLGSGAQMRGMTTGTSRGSEAASTARIECPQEIERSETSPLLTPHILSDINEQYLTVTDANDVQTLLVQVRHPGHAYEVSYVWPCAEQARALRTTGYSQESGTIINNSEDVAGTSLNANRQWIATVWPRGEVGRPLGTLDGNNSTAKAMNDAGTVIGDVYVSPVPHTGEFHRAYVWTDSNGMKYLPAKDGARSMAIDINNKGEILYWIEENGVNFSFVHHPSGQVRGIRTPNFHLYGTRLNDHGAVLGSAQDREGRRHSFVMDSSGRFTLLDAPTSFHAVDFDNEGNVVGFEERSPWQRAWLLTSQGQMAMLPALVNHSVDVCRIVNSCIYGHARQPSNWKHVHPLRWDIGSPKTNEVPAHRHYVPSSAQTPGNSRP